MCAMSLTGGWLLTIVGRNFGFYAGISHVSRVMSLGMSHVSRVMSLTPVCFGFYADVVNVSVGSSLYDNPLLSQPTGRYWHGKAVCRIPCTPGAQANGVGQIRADEYQCDREFVAGGGNAWMSDTHILCVMPAGVGVAKALSLAIGSAQLDGPSPVPALAATTQYGQGNGYA